MSSVSRTSASARARKEARDPRRDARERRHAAASSPGYSASGRESPPEIERASGFGRSGYEHRLVVSSTDRAFLETLAALKSKTSRASRGVAVAASPRAHHVARDRLLEAARGLVHVHGPLASSPRATRSRSASARSPRHPRACEPESRGARLSWRRDGIRRGNLRGGCASPPCRLAARRDARRGGGRGVRRRAVPPAGAVPRRCGVGGSGRG